MSHSIVNQFIHLAWATHNQLYHIPELIKNELYAYITTLINAKSGKVFSRGGSIDHIHLLILLPPDISLSSFISFIKAYSSKWIKKRDKIDPNFMWQKGYFAASVQDDKVDAVCQYISKDEDRHFSQKMSYQEELTEFLKKQNLSCEEQYLLQNSFAKVYLHIIWSTYNRSPDLIKKIRPFVYEQISKTISKNQSKVLSIGGVDDHVHMLVEMSKNVALSDMMREVKTHATHGIKTADYEKYHNFEWQTGYGAFSVSLSGLDHVKCYIEDQEEHHKKKSYSEEWNGFLMKLGGSRFVPSALHREI